MATLSTIEYTANPENAAFNNGVSAKKVYGSYAKTAVLPADGDYLIIGRNIPYNAVIHKINLTHGAISGLTDVDIVMLDASGVIIETGLVTSAGVVYLAETLTFATARTNADVLAALQKNIKTLVNAGGDKFKGAVDIALRIVTAGSSTGTIKVDIEYSTPC